MSGPRKTRAQRLPDVALKYEALAPFFMHESVQAFFVDYEAKQIDAITKADPSSDDEKHAALALRAMRALKRDMEQIIAAGKNAKDKLELMSNE